MKYINYIIFLIMVVILSGCTTNSRSYRAAPVRLSSVVRVSENDLDLVVKRLVSKISFHAREGSRLHRIAVIPGAIKNKECAVSRLDEVIVQRIRNQLSAKSAITLYVPGQIEYETYCRTGQFPTSQELLLYKVHITPRGTIVGIIIESCNVRSQEICFQFSEEIVNFKSASMAYRLYHSSPEQDWICCQEVEKKRTPVARKKAKRRQGRIAVNRKMRKDSSIISVSIQDLSTIVPTVKTYSITPRAVKRKQPSGSRHSGFASLQPVIFSKTNSLKVCFQGFLKQDFRHLRAALGVVSNNNFTQSNDCPAYTSCPCFIINRQGISIADVQAVMSDEFQGVSDGVLYEEAFDVKNNWLKFTCSIGQD